MSATDTIYALASGSLPAGIAVLRISGPKAEAALVHLAGRLPEPRCARLMTLRNAAGTALDQALVLAFPGTATFTGEPVVELHLHGGRAVVQAVCQAIAEVADTRLAEPGEFTRRAFINGKMDLTAAEGVADLVAAETEQQRVYAFRNAGGAQQALYSSWREQLLEARAMIEADLDFADEGDVPGSVADDVLTRVDALKGQLVQHLSQARVGEIVMNGFRVVIAGEPNVGKSSLINTLAKRDVAIVTDQAGTTRDLLEVSLDLNGVKVILTDTAGLRDSEDVVEQIGISRARSAIEHADLVLHLHPAGESHPLLSAGPEVINVYSKGDLAAAGIGGLTISTRTGEGVAELIDTIRLRAQEATHAADVVPTRERHRAQLAIAAQCLDKVKASLPLEIQAEELRLAADALGRVTGAMGVEDLLDVIFSRFCIGK